MAEGFCDVPKVLQPGCGMRRDSHEGTSGRGQSTLCLPAPTHDAGGEGGGALHLSWEEDEREIKDCQTQGCPHPSQGWLCPWPQCLPGFPVTTLWASSVKWVHARAVGAHGRPGVPH